MKKFFQYLAGLNAASIIRGLRFGFQEFLNACYRSLGAVHPFEDRKTIAEEATLEAIPEVSLDEILGDREVEIKLIAQRHEDGMLAGGEAQALIAILVLENPKEVLEIGTFMGHTTRRMAENLKDSIVHTVDLPPDFSTAQESVGLPPKDDFHLINRRVVGREFKGRDCEKRIVQHFGDTAQMDFKKIGRPAFFFIDGAHTYEYCRQDSEKCLDLCSGNGTFLWHDCDEWHPGVVRFISEWIRSGKNIVRIKGTHFAYWKAQAAS
jgi:Methyltransferase domain